MNYHHRRIKKFGLDGVIHDEGRIPRLKDQYIFMVVTSMKSQGYVPRYDIDPDFTVSYNGRGFDFELSIYGVFVGRKKAEWIEGLDGAKPVVITQQNKSEEYSDQ
jgi:hypothetical protein